MVALLPGRISGFIPGGGGGGGGGGGIEIESGIFLQLQQLIFFTS